MNIESNIQELIVIQIPYDEGWIVTNNGKKVKVENVDNGLIGIVVQKGQNNIKFSYNPPKLKMGIIIAILSLFTYTTYILLGYKKK